MTYTSFDHYALARLMSAHLEYKRALVKLRDAMEYEEYKGIFRGWKLQTLTEEYERTKRILRQVEKVLMNYCGTVDKLI